METKKNTFMPDAIKSLEIRVVTANVQIKCSEDTLIHVEAESLQEMDYVCEVRNQKLVVLYGVEGKKHLINFNWKEAQIVLCFPKGKIFEHVALEIGAGKWRAAGLQVSGRLDLQVGAGEVKMKTATVGTLNLECGVGACVYRGCVNEDIKVDCGVGSCKFELDNKESDFNYDVSCALGNVRINKSSIRCLGSKKIYSDSKAKGTITLKCGLGNIELNTIEKAKATVHINE